MGRPQLRAAESIGRGISTRVPTPRYAAPLPAGAPKGPILLTFSSKNSMVKPTAASCVGPSARRRRLRRWRCCQLSSNQTIRLRANARLLPVLYLQANWISTLINELKSGLAHTSMLETINCPARLPSFCSRHFDARHLPIRHTRMVVSHSRHKRACGTICGCPPAVSRHWELLAEFRNYGSRGSPVRHLINNHADNSSRLLWLLTVCDHIIVG